MRRLISYHAFNVFEIATDRWTHSPHTHNFFELIYITEGDGLHVLNDVTVNYSRGDVFLLGPADWHEFHIGGHTRFIFIKFTEQLFIEEQSRFWNSHFVKMLSNINGMPQSLIHDTADRTKVSELISALYAEFTGKPENYRQVGFNLLEAILLIISRNLRGEPLTAVRTDREPEYDRVQEVLSYIRTNMHNRKAISLQAIASTFLMSPNYIGAFIKKHTGYTLQHQIAESRIKVAERLLTQSSYTVSEIAAKVGFNDASHLTKAFKRYRNSAPGAYRKL